MSIKLLFSCFVSFFDLYQEYNNCLISFLSFSELFPAFNRAKEIGNLLSIWSGVSIFNPPPDCFSLLNLIISLKIFTILFGFSIFFFSFLNQLIHFQLHLLTYCFDFYLLPKQYVLNNKNVF